jgi:hypothetical protein
MVVCTLAYGTSCLTNRIISVPSFFDINIVVAYYTTVSNTVTVVIKDDVLIRLINALPLYGSFALSTIKSCSLAYGYRPSVVQSILSIDLFLHPNPTASNSSNIALI